ATTPPATTPPSSNQPTTPAPATTGRTSPGHGSGTIPSSTPLGGHRAEHHHSHGSATRPGHGGSVPGTGPSEPQVGSLSPAAPGFLGPASWTGTVAPSQALTGAVDNLSGLLTDGDRPPSFLIPIYMQAGARFGVPWEVLAAINAIESDYGRDLSTSTAGAIGWMQFEPSTWRQYGMAVDGHSVPNPYDPRDAIFSAARYLSAAGARHDIAGAVYSYNHAGWYVNEVLSRARAIATTPQFVRTTLRRRTFSVSFATGLRRHPTISYRGGVLSHFDRLIAAANMVSAANFPYLYGGGHEQPARFGPFDCSGAVSYVMQQGGYKVATTVSGEIPIWRFPAGPGRVTIFYNAIHTFMRIGGRYFGTSGFARPGGGAGWFDVNRLPASYLATFREVHVPGLGVDSFSATSDAALLASSSSSTRRHRGLRFSSGQLSSLGSFPAS
ncbi:MAG: lytic transglycosylase domain-containing protein, partial [Solirubrobacteraceae bacterium]